MALDLLQQSDGADTAFQDGTHGRKTILSSCEHQVPRPSAGTQHERKEMQLAWCSPKQQHWTFALKDVFGGHPQPPQNALHALAKVLVLTRRQCYPCGSTPARDVLVAGSAEGGRECAPKAEDPTASIVSRPICSPSMAIGGMGIDMGHRHGHKHWHG